MSALIAIEWLHSCNPRNKSGHRERRIPAFPRMCEALSLDLRISTSDRDTWPGDAEGRVALKQGFGPPQPAGNIAMTFFTKVP
jgi:hypothetical protein